MFKLVLFGTGHYKHTLHHIKKYVIPPLRSPILLRSTKYCILSINATFLKVLRKWSRVASHLIISTIILITFIRMNHFDLLPLLELNFCFESFESLQRVRLLTNELNKTITEIFINKHDEIFVVTHSKRSE